MRSEADDNLIVYFYGQYVPLRQARVGILRRQQPTKNDTMHPAETSVA